MTKGIVMTPADLRKFSEIGQKIFDADFATVVAKVEAERKETK